MQVTFLMSFHALSFFSRSTASLVFLYPSTLSSTTSGTSGISSIRCPAIQYQYVLTTAPRNGPCSLGFCQVCSQPSKGMHQWLGPALLLTEIPFALDWFKDAHGWHSIQLTVQLCCWILPKYTTTHNFLFASNLSTAVLTFGHDQGRESRGSQGRADGIALLCDIDPAVPTAPGLCGGEHSATTTHLHISQGPALEDKTLKSVSLAMIEPAQNLCSSFFSTSMWQQATVVVCRVRRKLHHHSKL